MGINKQTIKPAIVFRGKGKIASDELAKYDKRVDVYFQDKGWMDIKTNREWTERTLMPGILDTRKESVLFADNVSFQTEKEFHEILKSLTPLFIYCHRIKQIKYNR